MHVCKVRHEDGSAQSRASTSVDDVADGVGRLHIQSDGLSGESFDENLKVSLKRRNDDEIGIKL